MSRSHAGPYAASLCTVIVSAEVIAECMGKCPVEEEIRQPSLETFDRILNEDLPGGFKGHPCVHKLLHMVPRLTLEGNEQQIATLIFGCITTASVTSTLMKR